MSEEPELRITYIRHPVPFEAIIAAAEKTGCSKVSVWGDRGDWDTYHPTLDPDAEMPCYVVYGRDMRRCTWDETELSVLHDNKHMSLEGRLLLDIHGAEALSVMRMGTGVPFMKEGGIRTHQLAASL